MLIIWITWTLGAGKWTVVEYLIQKYGFKHLSVRAFLIEKILERGMENNRDSMVLVANDLREKFGPGYIASELYEKAAKTGENTIIESIRTVGEITTLKAKWPFVLLAVDADPSIRYERITSRASETDHLDYTTFIANEEREMTSDDPNKQNLQACISMADYTILNNGSLEEFHSKVDDIMKQITTMKSPL